MNEDKRELCGCGRPWRYMTPSGNACNKYKRCPEEFKEDLKTIKNALVKSFKTIYSNASYDERMNILKGTEE